MADLTLDPNSLQGLLSQFQPTEADRQAARQQAQLQFFLGLLGAPKGGEWQRIGQSGANALQGYNDQLVNSQKAALARMQAANLGMTTLEKQQQLKDAAALRQAGIDWAKQNGAGASGLPQLGAPPQAGGMGMQPSPKRAQYEQAMAYAQFLKSRGLVQQALAQEQHALTLLPKRVDTKTLTTPDGKRAVVNIYDDGTQEVLPFGPDQEKLHFADTGSGVQGVNPLTGQTVGAPIPKTLTPGEQLTIPETARHNQALEGNAAATLGETRRHHGVTESQAATTQARYDEKIQKQDRGTVDMADRVLGMINEVTPKLGSTTTGIVGSLLGKVPQTPAYDVRATVDSIRANLGFEQLQAMRNSSPTGGALGQVSDLENRLLQAAVANLDANQSEDQLRANLAKVQLHLNNVKRLIQQNGTAPAATPAAPVGPPAAGKTVVRTGMYNGRKVIQYSDGTVNYAQ